jgi:hypothetical protein
MKLLKKIKNHENKLKLLKLVNAGHNTASVFSVYYLREKAKDDASKWILSLEGLLL